MKRYLVFVAVGPLLGGFWLLLTTTLMSGYWSKPPNAAEVTKLLTVFATTLQYSYLFGLLPALMIGAVAFVLAELNYGSRGSDSGVLQFVMYGLVGFIPVTFSSWLVHKFVDEDQVAPEQPPVQSSS